MAVTNERIAEMRKHPISENDAKRDAGLTTPADIVRFDDIRYGTLGEHPDWQLLDVYRPKAVPVSEKLPVIISVHGGGWVYGVKEVYQYYCMSLAQHGFAVINFNYRLAPEYKFPCNEEDTNQVVSWMLAHAEEYGFDTDNVFAVGDSAGGSNLGIYAAITSNPEYAAKFPFKVPEGFHFNAIGLFCAALTDDFFLRSPVERFRESTYETQWSSLMPEGYTKEDCAILNVVPNVTGAYPPTYIMTCISDFLVNEPMEICRKFMEEKVSFNFHYFGTPEEPLHHVFHCDIRNPQAVICNDEACAFFKAWMK